MKRTYTALLLAGVVLGSAAFTHSICWADGATATAEAQTGAHEGFGPHMWLLKAVDSLTLRADQQAAVAQLKADMQARSAPLRAAHQQIREAIAASVEAGTVDHARIDPLVTAAAAAMSAHSDDFEESANRLHGILDAAQRQALVDALRANMGRGHHGHRPEGWGGRGEAHMQQLATDLGLTDAQIATFRAQFSALHTQERAAHEASSAQRSAGMQEHRARLQAMAAAFVGDSFDAHALQVGQHLPAAVPNMATKMLSRVELALPLLTPAQRTILAQKIRSGHVEHALE